MIVMGIYSRDQTQGITNTFTVIGRCFKMGGRERGSEEMSESER